MQEVLTDGERLVEAALETPGDIHDLIPCLDQWKQDGELVAAQPGQHVARAELVFHAERYFLQISVADLVAIDVIHFLEVVEVDVNQSEGAGLPAGLLNSLIEVLFHGESVVNVSEQIEF